MGTISILILLLLGFAVEWIFYWSYIYPKGRLKEKKEVLDNEKVLRLDYERLNQNNQDIIGFSFIIAGFGLSIKVNFFGFVLMIFGILMLLDSLRFSGKAERVYWRLRKLLLTKKE